MLIANCVIFGLFVVWSVIGFKKDSRETPEWFVVVWCGLGVLSMYALGLWGGWGSDGSGTILGELYMKLF